MDNIKFSLITTVYNEDKNIEVFLDSYKKQTKYAHEFVIVDGGSTDNTVSIINNYSKQNENLNIKLIIDKTCSKKYVNGPIAKGRNIAIENSNFEYIVATDAGCLLNYNWFEEITKPFSNENIDVVSGWYEPNIKNKFQEDYSSIAMKSVDDIDPEKFLPSSRSIAFKKECWLKVGKYPTFTYTAEDTLFDLNLKKEGYTFKFAKNAIVYWDCPYDFDEMIKKTNCIWFWRWTIKNK